LNKEIKLRRIGLDAQSSRIIQEKVNELKKEKAHLKVNDSKFASKIIMLFFNKYYQKDKELIEKSFFDQKAYLQEIIKKANSNEELLDSIQSYVSKNRKRKTKKKILPNN